MPDDTSPEIERISDTPSESHPSEPRWRLDAVAATLYFAILGLGVALIGYPPLGGLDLGLGERGDWLAGMLVDALGLAAYGLLLGGFILVSLYVARRSALRLLIRGLGWGLLIATAATIADLLSGVVSWNPVSVYGLGGAVGAFLRMSLEARFEFPASILLLMAAGLTGLLLAADGLVRFIVRAILLLLRSMMLAAIRGNRGVARLGDHLLQWLSRIVPRRKIMSSGLLEDQVGGADLSRTGTAASGTTNPSTIPITRGGGPEVGPDVPPLRLITGIDAEPSHSEPMQVPGPSGPGYELPPLSLLADPDPYAVGDHEQKLRDRAALLEKTFQDFGLNIKVVGIHTGPVVTQYEVALETGLRLNKVTNLADDIALTLAVPSVRIVAPLPGRTTVGIEVPNDQRRTVRLKEVITATANKAAKFKLPIYLGMDVEGRPLVYDMATMPHLLIAGRTGTGKSVCLNTILLSFLFSRSPDECRLILIDPKQVEFSDYSQLPHLMTPVVTKNEKAEAILAWAVDKMEERYELLRKARVRNIASYNELGGPEVYRRVQPSSEEERQATPVQLPYIVIVIDEVGDLIMAMKKEVESHIIRLAQKSRAAGIHLILATQRPTVDVVTGLIKSNLPARICFQVSSRGDSAVVLDEKGAEKLLGMGDMLFLQPGTSTIIRGQGAYVDDREIQRVTQALEIYEPNFESELLNLKAKDAVGDGGNVGAKLRERDPLYEQAVEVVIREQRGSTSLLQRALGIGYGKASRFIDWMAEDGIVGPYNGSNARDVLVSAEEWDFRKHSA